MNGSTGNIVTAQLTLSTVIVYGIEWLKGQAWFPFANVNTPRLNRLVAAVAAALGALGIHYQFAHGTLTITGLTLAGVTAFGGEVIRNFVVQHLIYKVAINPPAPATAPTAGPRAVLPSMPVTGTALGAMLICLVLIGGTLGCVKNSSGQTVPQAPEKTWRDSLAAATGALTYEKSVYFEKCAASPGVPACRSRRDLTNKAIAAHTLAKDALIAYCSGDPQAFNAGAPCQPVESAAPAIASALSQLQDILKQVEALQ